MTEFQPNEQRKITLNRAFVVNQYKAANQLMRLVAPNASSHRGIPAHLGDPRKPLEIVSRAVAIYEELADNSGVATILAAGAEVALRLGNLQEALRQAEGCQNEYSRLADQQGTQFTCFTGTKVHILTQKALKVWPRHIGCSAIYSLLMENYSPLLGRCSHLYR